MSSTWRFIFITVKLPHFTTPKADAKDDSTFNFFSRLGFHKKLSYKEQQLAPDFAKDLHIICRQTIKTEELGKVTVYFVKPNRLSHP